VVVEEELLDQEQMVVTMAQVQVVMVAMVQQQQ
jgi:hypothetical protein